MNSIVFGLIAGVVFRLVDMALMLPMDFPDKKGERERSDAKMELISTARGPWLTLSRPCANSVPMIGRSSRF